MNLLNKLTIKNLKLNKKRTIVTIIGITLSVALITAVASIYASAIKSLITYEKQEKGNFHVAFYNVPINEIDTFKYNREIEKINLVKNIGYAKIASKNEDKPYAYIKAFTTSALENLSIKLVEGRLPENENEILIPTHLETNGRLKLNVGETITLEVGKRVTNDNYELDQSNPYVSEAIVEEINGQENTLKEQSNEKIIDTKTITYKIVGKIQRPATNIEEYSAPGYTFITYIEENNIQEGKVDVYARYTKEGTKNADKVTANIIGIDEDLYEKIMQGKFTKENYDQYLEQREHKKYEEKMNSYLIGLETNPIKDSGIGGLGAVVCIVLGIIIVTSVFCIKNSFDISITEKIKQYGMLRSIGATKKQIKKNVFYEATILGIIGIPLGIISGFIASYILIIVSNYYLNNFLTEEGLKLEFVFSIMAVIISIILGIVTIYFSALKSAKKASKITPIDSIRNSADIKINYKKIKTPKIIKKIFGMGGEISLKNLKRNKKKYRTTIISIAVSVMVFISLSSFMSIAFDLVEQELNLTEYNLSLYVRKLKNDDDYKKYQEITQLEGIEDYAIIRRESISFIGKQLAFSKEYIDWFNIEPNEEVRTGIILTVLGDEPYKKYIKELGLDYEEIKDKGILIDYLTMTSKDENNKEHKQYMRVYSYQVGDKIKGIMQNDETTTIEIGYLTDKKPIWLKNSTTGSLLILSDELFDKIAQANTEEILFKTSNANKLQDDIERTLKDEGSYSISNIDENVKAMNNLFTLIGIFLYGFIIVITLIGITNIFNTITTNMELRKQEFAMLKSIGMTTKEFSRMIKLETAFMGIKALVFGIPVGIILSYVIHYLLKDELDGLPYKLPILAILITIIAVFILISLIMRYSMNKINKQNTIETIRNENI